MSALTFHPAEFPELLTIKDGSLLLLRPLRVDDGDRLCRMYQRLSPETVYRRFMVVAPKLTRSSLAHLTDVDHAMREAIVAVAGGEIIAVARYHQARSKSDAEVAVVVEDRWQRRGIGRILFDRLSDLAAARGIDAFTGFMLGSNDGAARFLLSVAPQAERKIQQGELIFRAPLRLEGRERAKRPALRSVAAFARRGDFWR